MTTNEPAPIEQYLATKPYWSAEDTDEDGNPVCYVEIQTIGGHAVVATVWGSTLDQASLRADLCIAAWSNRTASIPAEPPAWPTVAPCDRRLVEKVALVLINDDRGAAGLPPVTSRDIIPNSEGYVRNACAALSAITPSIRAKALEDADAVFKEERCAQAERLGLTPTETDSPVRYFERVRRAALRSLAGEQSS